MSLPSPTRIRFDFSQPNLGVPDALARLVREWHYDASPVDLFYGPPDREYQERVRVEREEGLAAGLSMPLAVEVGEDGKDLDPEEAPYLLDLTGLVRAERDGEVLWKGVVPALTDEGGSYLVRIFGRPVGRVSGREPCYVQGDPTGTPYASLAEAAEALVTKALAEVAEQSKRRPRR